MSGLKIGSKIKKKDISNLEKELRQLEEIISKAKKYPETLKTIKVIATAYTSGPESTGKSPTMSGYGITYSGLPALKGTVAVDPDMMPLGSVLKIPGI